MGDVFQYWLCYDPCGRLMLCACRAMDPFGVYCVYWLFGVDCVYRPFGGGLCLWNLAGHYDYGPFVVIMDHVTDPWWAGVIRWIMICYVMNCVFRGQDYVTYATMRIGGNTWEQDNKDFANHTNHTMVQNRSISRDKKPIWYQYQSRLSVRRSHHGVKFYFNPKKFTKISKKI